MTAYSRKAPGTVNMFTNDRKVSVTRSVPHHRQTVATDIARPRTRVGQISAIITHVPVPTPIAKHATYVRTKTRTTKPDA